MASWAGRGEELLERTDVAKSDRQRERRGERRSPIMEQCCERRVNSALTVSLWRDSSRQVWLRKIQPVRLFEHTEKGIISNELKIVTNVQLFDMVSSNNFDHFDTF